MLDILEPCFTHLAFGEPEQGRARHCHEKRRMVAMITWHFRLSRMRRNSFRNSISRSGESADSGASKR